jgi:type IV pilus assembly protein PilM
MLRALKYLVSDPPPLLVFEISRQAVVGAQRHPRSLRIERRAEHRLPEGAIEPDPGRLNVHDPEALRRAVANLLEQLGPVRRPQVALILPDASARLTVLDFDQFPADAQEQQKLLRFRLKKTVPFDIEQARLACRTWPSAGGFSVLVAAVPAEIVRQYEAPFEDAGLWPGHVSLSTAAALNLNRGGEMILFVKLAGGAMTIAAVDGSAVRMIRNVETLQLSQTTPRQALADIAADLYPTMVFVADRLGTAVRRVLLCGFGDLLAPALEFLPGDLGCPVEPLRSAQGIVAPAEAGLWGYVSAS